MQLNLKRPLYLWNLLIRNSTQNHNFTECLKIYSSMVKSGRRGSSFTFPLILKACAELRSLQDASKLHSHLFVVGFQADVFVQTALLDAYSKCRDLSASRQVFDEMPMRTIVSWNSMIAAYACNSCVNESFGLLNQVLAFRLEASSVTFVGILSGCSASVSVCSLSQALLIHSCVTKLGLHSDIPLSNSIIRLYVNFNHIDGARSIFDAMDEKSIISWTTMLTGYVNVSNVSEAFCLFDQMRRENVQPDSIVFINLILGCAQVKNLLLASSVHSLVLKSGCIRTGSTDNLLVTMYAKCADLFSAQRIFDMANEKNVYLWTSMIGAYTHLGYPREALNLFSQLLLTTVRPNAVTMATILSACADLGSLRTGKQIEDYILLNSLESDLRVQTSLVHMFCKCGNIKKAEAVFERVRNKDLAVWSAMINGYAINGMGMKALRLFHKMLNEEGIKPDAVVFTSILLACNHSGLVEDGLKYFETMQTDFGIEPSIEHYSCLVDLLSRAGYFDLALKAIQEIPVQMQAQAWAPLVSACRTHGNAELGEFAATKLADLDPKYAGNYVLMSNFYTSIGKWNEAATARGLINDRGLVKELGYSKIEVNGSPGVFNSRDQSLLQLRKIYKKLKIAEC